MDNEIIISGSIVLYNPDMKQLARTIKSFAPSRERFLYLIDNSSVQTDITSIILGEKFIDYHFIGENKGYGAGHNIAIRLALKAGSKYHVVLNPDLEFDPSIIDKIAEFMNRDGAIAQVMPKILNQQKEVQYLCKLLPTPMDLFFKRFLSKQSSEKILSRFQLKFADYNKQMNVPFLSGCFMFFRTSAFESVGLFDERFFMYAEDIDITRRMHRIYKTIYYPEVSIVHTHKAESYKSWRMLNIHIKNIIKYFNKWGWFFDRERSSANAKVLRELENP
jgi:GT2 family glycosyltransferase